MSIDRALFELVARGSGSGFLLYAIQFTKHYHHTHAGGLQAVSPVVVRRGTQLGIEVVV